MFLGENNVLGKAWVVICFFFGMVKVAWRRSFGFGWLVGDQGWGLGSIGHVMLCYVSLDFGEKVIL